MHVERCALAVYVYVRVVKKSCGHKLSSGELEFVSHVMPTIGLSLKE